MPQHNKHSVDADHIGKDWLIKKSRSKVAGEVIFKKDKSGDSAQWAYSDTPPSLREIPSDFSYGSRHQKPLVTVLRSTLAALGHTLSGYNQFAKVKSARVSPDGSLGGRGYIQKIGDMRKQYMNCVEALSALSDTLYDEIHASHWVPRPGNESRKDREEVTSLMGDAEEIRADPQSWAEDEIAQGFGQSGASPAAHRHDLADNGTESETPSFESGPFIQNPGSGSPLSSNLPNGGYKQATSSPPLLSPLRSDSAISHRVAAFWLTQNKRSPLDV